MSSRTWRIVLDLCHRDNTDNDRASTYRKENASAEDTNNGINFKSNLTLYLKKKNLQNRCLGDTPTYNAGRRINYVQINS
uniref:Uncharacterized protein n=1 Tax=Romanomermis culicivorax TaxID=13658 RepID=A0A915L4U3_ROMCU